MESLTMHLIEKIQSLPRSRLQEVEDFIDFISQREADRQLMNDAMRTSEASFAKVWDNSEDAEYDHL
ncbi:MAG: toxin-antitoxin system, antitoxin component, Xre family protein [SAR324 cluster bacterium]|nr:toxin-antitoxin system, antitoxin component, Xre family protein [SAR324 cluster bacterium]